jgi:outer membrane receptor protein involved in Fe transport
LHRSAILAATLFLVSSVRAAAQAGNATRKGEIVGRVVNSLDKGPITSANVEVTVAGTKTVVGRAVTSTAGTFRIVNLGVSARYRVFIRALGFRPTEVVAVDLFSATPRADLGTIVLTATATQLEAVETIVHRADVLLAPDRNTIVVRDMPTTRGGNALDVLRNVPAVDVDLDNIVSLRGNSGVTIQINGRPSPMKPGPLGNFLSQLPADMVDKIEVIPNPSARDDPTGTAGIINIVLKQKADAGTNGGVTLSAGTTGQFNTGANLGFDRGPLTFYGSYGFLRDRRPRADSIFRENDYLSPVTYLDERGTRLQKPLAHTMTASTTYSLADKDELSLDVTYSTRNQDESYGLVYRDLNTARTLTGMSDRLTTGRGTESNFETVLGFKHGFAQKGHKLSLEGSIVRDAEGGPNTVTSSSLTPAGDLIGQTALETNTSFEHPRENNVKLDYVRPLAQLVRLEAGYKGSLQEFHTTLDTHLFDAGTHAYVPDSTRISDFTFDETVNAGYALVSGQHGRFQLQGGLRGELAASTFKLATTGARYDRRYHSLFPSALVAYNLDDAHQIKLSYSSRIRRPDEGDQLDPTAHYADPLNLSRGNPYLKPEYTRAIELGLQRTGARVTVQVTPYWRRTFDAVRSIRAIDTNGVSTRTYANISTADAYGGDATVSLSGGRLTGFVGVSGFHQVSNAANVTPGLSINAWGWRERANATYRFSKTLDVQTLLSYTPPMTIEQGRNYSRSQFNIAGRKKLMDDQLAITLRVIDPFNTSRERSTTVDPRFLQFTSRARQVRGVLLGANWTFGKPVKDNTDLVGGLP